MARAQRNAVLIFGRAESLNSVSKEDDPTISGSLSLRFLSFLRKMPIPAGANMGGPSTADKRKFGHWARWRMC